MKFKLILLFLAVVNVLNSQTHMLNSNKSNLKTIEKEIVNKASDKQAIDLINIEAETNRKLKQKTEEILAQNEEYQQIMIAYQKAKMDKENLLRQKYPSYSEILTNIEKEKKAKAAEKQRLKEEKNLAKKAKAAEKQRLKEEKNLAKEAKVAEKQKLKEEKMAMKKLSKKKPK